MEACALKNSSERQILKKVSGVSDFELDSTIKYFDRKYKRFPYLDELDNADSSEYVKDLLQVKTTKDLNFVSIDTLLNKTNTNSIEEAVILLNNKFRDLEIYITPFNTDALINIRKRPSNTYIDNDVITDAEFTPEKSRIVLSNMIYKLQKQFGINIKTISQEDLGQDNWKDIMPLDSLVNGFIYNGDIYINVDNASIDTPIHELMHLFLGSIKYTNPDLYLKLIDTITLLPNFQALTKALSYKTFNDIKEEIFVDLFSKYLVGVNSSMDTLYKDSLYDIMYEVKRLLDSMLEGVNSVKLLDNSTLVNSSLLKLASLVSSEVMNNNKVSSLDLASLSRNVANIKSDLLKNNMLEEQCN